MKKTEIIKRLEELKRLLDMTSAEYAAEWNSKHPDDRYKLKPEEVWAFRTGVALSEIEWILEN